MLATKGRTTAQRQFDTERYILQSLPALYLPLWKRDGASFMSDDGYGHICTNYGSLWTPQGRQFGPTVRDDYISIPDHDALDIIDKISIKVWLKLNSVAPEYQGVFAKRKPTPAYDVINYFAYINYTQLVWGFCSPDVAYKLIFSTATLVADKWYCLGFIYDKVNLTLEIDNIVEKTAQTATLLANTYNLLIGSDAAANCLSSIVGEIGIWPRALTLIERQQFRLATCWRYQ